MTTHHCHSTSKGTYKGLGSSGASVERPLSSDSPNYTLRYCVTPESSEKPALCINSHGAINSFLRPHLQLSSASSTAFPAFEVMELVRPFTGTYSKTQHLESALSVRLKAESAPASHCNSTSPGSPAAFCDHGMRSIESRRNQRNRVTLSGNVQHKLFNESSSSSRATYQALSHSNVVPAKSFPYYNDDHNGSGFKPIKGVGHHSSTVTGNMKTTAGARPWHQTSEPVPMKYFMNGVRLVTSSPSDVITGNVIQPSAASAAALRPSLFSSRRHHDSLCTSLKSLLQAPDPDRYRMTKEAALDFIQGQVDVWYAACQGDTSLVAAYIDAGVLVDALDRRYGRTPLQYASGNNNTAIVRLLLQAGASVHSHGSRDKHRNTPLHFAALYGKIEAALYLLDNGANCMGLNANGLTPLDLARDNCHMETVALLKKYGAISIQ